MSKFPFYIPTKQDFPNLLENSFATRLTSLQDDIDGLHAGKQKPGRQRISDFNDDPEQGKKFVREEISNIEQLAAENLHELNAACELMIFRSAQKRLVDRAKKSRNIWVAVDVISIVAMGYVVLSGVAATSLLLPFLPYVIIAIAAYNLYHEVTKVEKLKKDNNYATAAEDIRASGIAVKNGQEYRNVIANFLGDEEKKPGLFAAPIDGINDEVRAYAAERSKEAIGKIVKWEGVANEDGEVVDPKKDAGTIIQSTYGACFFGDKHDDWHADSKLVAALGMDDPVKALEFWQNPSEHPAKYASQKLKGKMVVAALSL